MLFCKKCGGVLVPKGDKLVCSKCGETYEKEGNPLITVEHTKKRRGIVELESFENEMLPITEVQCPKCGYNKAYFTLEQTRAADEPATRIFKCVKCGYTWMEYQ